MQARRQGSVRRESFDLHRISTNNGNASGRIPKRTSKIGQKLTLFPDEMDFKVGESAAGGSYAELHKSERSQIPRVTAYCIAEDFNLPRVREFVQHSHGVKVKRFDECIYFSYDAQAKEMMFGNPNAIYAYPLLFTATSVVESMEPHASIALNDSNNSIYRSYPEWMNRGEVFIFDYGVIVFWNFTELEETEFMSHLRPYGNDYLDQLEIEDLHFQYDVGGPNNPKVYNDMITLKGYAPLIKLTISHAMAQSVKLSVFEKLMGVTIEGAVPLSQVLAETGEVPMDREAVMKIVGMLHELKMDVNLISNVLDTPEMIWSEPGLEGLYTAVRKYFEISQRAGILNSRADVLNDLLSMLSDHLNTNEMTYITWIIIILICLAVIVAICEVGVKFMMMKAGIGF